MDTTLADPLIGQRLDGRYRIDRRIARGGMATVYAGFDTRLDRTVAVKVMHPALAEDEQFVARFIREAKAAARLSSPDVVSVFDQGADGSHVFLVMELVAGRTLRDLLRERGRLSAGQAVAVLEPVLSALAAAHRAGLVHRDVKPENVLLGDDGRVKVADFGLARALQVSSLTATTGLLLGTVAYLAPEQVADGTSDTRSDVYAAGIVLYEMLTGSPPYAGETPLSVAYRHVHDDVPAPSETVDGVPDSLDALAVRATRRDPATRPADAGVFLASVRAVRRYLEAAGTDVSVGLPGGGEVTVGPGPTTQKLPAAPAAGVAGAESDPTDTKPDEAAAAQPVSDTETITLRRDDDDRHSTLVAPLGGPGAGGPARHQRRRVALLAVAAVLLAAVVGAGAWWFGAGRYVDAPDLLGLDRATAEEQAAAAGLSVEVGEPDHSETVPVGRVLTQDPEPGGGVTRNGTVTIALSLGPERFAVPDLTGEPLETARDALAEANLELGAVSRTYDQEVPEGAVISTEPEAGAELRRDTPVALVVSRGREPVTVPDVVGQESGAARTSLEEAGFSVTVQEAFDEEVAAGRVVSSEPEGDSTALRGDEVTLVVSRGPELFTVPDLSDLSRAEAESALEELGLNARVVDVPGGSGRVLSQRPGAGAELRRDSTVTLFIF